MRNSNEEDWRAAVLLGACIPSVRDTLADDRSIEALLEEHLSQGKMRWPDLDFDYEIYLRHVGTLLGNASIACPRKHLDSLAASDVYLAAACLAGSEDAQQALLNETRPKLGRSLRKLGASPETCDEVEQRVFEMVLLGERPQLLGYTGKGSLGGWIRTIAIRTCRRTLGLERQHAGEARDLDGLASPNEDVEIGYLKERYREQFRDAFLGAASELSERQRNILRQQHRDGLSIDALAQLYKVHRATAARWAASARLALLDGTKNRLRHAIGVDTQDFKSILRLVQSQLDVGIDTLLD